MRFNIIAVDESGITRLELSSMLKGMNVNVISMKDEAELIKLLSDTKYEFHSIVWAYNDNMTNCFAAIKKLKRNPLYRHIPVVIVSQFNDKKYIIKAIAAGAVEYITKPFNEKTIRSKMHKVLGIPYVSKEFPVYDDDLLTFNFHDMFSRELKAAARGNYAFSILIATLSEDTGVQEGNINTEELVQVMRRVTKIKLRETDTCFRYGNDSLIVLLPFTDKNGAGIVEKKIIENFDNHSIIIKKNTEHILVTTSVSFPEDGKTQEKLLGNLEAKFNVTIGSVDIDEISDSDAASNPDNNSE